MSTLGARLKTLRAGSGKTQEEIAQALGTSRATLANWEVDRTQPDPDTLKRLADLYDVSIDYLVGRSDDRKPSGLPGSLDPSDPRVKRLADLGVFLHTPFPLDEQDIKEIEEVLEYRRLRVARRRAREEEKKKGGAPGQA